MKYYVQVEGEAIKSFDSADKAIIYASLIVYLGPEDRVIATNDLELGQIAEWSYGFKGVQIIPKSA
jgi:hypothetical protein